MIRRKCPGCGSRNVRRSKRIVSEMTWNRNFISPYRCHDCEKRFSRISKNTYYLAGIVALAIGAGLFVWSEFEILDYRYPKSEPKVTSLKTVADTTKLAQKQDPVAEYTLAQIYAQGDGVPKDDAQARKWLKLAAEHGNPEAEYEMGMALREGRDVIQDYDAALKWFIRAAETGNARAQFELGHMYRVGMGVPIDNVKAYMWFNLAASNGNADADRARITVLPLLSRADIMEAQREAHRWSDARAKPATQ
ncbi:MAG: sel1 repeat family protein [Betaproteobacteria bacterium]|nr:MAG: sel1 repeat family protein [Betaproteobacteria bacterium]